MPNPKLVNVTFNGFNGGVDQYALDVGLGTQMITWQLPPNGPFQFADPPVIFSGPRPLPFTKDQVSGQRATYTDNNANSTGQYQVYYYQLRVIAGDILIIWPANELDRGPTPVIRNRPTKISGSNAHKNRKQNRPMTTKVVPRGRQHNASRNH